MTRDRILVACAAIGALGYLYLDYRMPRLQLGDPLGPRAFPALIGVLLLFSAGLLAFETRAGVSRIPVPGKARDSAAAAGGSHVKVLLGMLAWTILYYAAFDPLGYVVSTPVYLFGLLCFFNKDRHLANLAIAIGFTAIAFGVFSQLLSVQLPQGPLGF